MNTWTGDFRVSDHITNDDTILFDIMYINESIQGSSGNMPAIKKGSFTPMTNKLMAPSMSILYGL